MNQEINTHIFILQWLYSGCNDIWLYKYVFSSWMTLSSRNLFAGPGLIFSPKLVENFSVPLKKSGAAGAAAAETSVAGDSAQR